MDLIRHVARNAVLASGLALALPAVAGTISGILRNSSGPLNSAAVKLTCGDRQSVGQTDANGNYSLSIASSGVCTLTVNDTSTAKVLLGKDPARYSFELPRSGNAMLQR